MSQGGGDGAFRRSSTICSLLLGLALSALAPSMTETAVANGDTRTIYLYHTHTGESIAATYLVGGQYDSSVLQKLNWFLRDWRLDQPTNMDPRLFDVVWEAYRAAGAGAEPIRVVSAYRSPETNAMLRARSRAVAKHSQHMLGKAMDTTMPGMPMSRVRELGMKMQRGGVGYYPTAGTPFVHLDVGAVRAWPRMTYEQLARLFPDGKTVHIAANGQLLARYEEAKAEIEARNNGATVLAAPRGGFFGFLASIFGGGADEQEDAAPPPPPRKQWAQLAPRASRSARRAAEENEEAGAPTESTTERGRLLIAKAEADLPRGETALSAPDVDAIAPRRKEPPRVDAPLPPLRPAGLEKPTPLDQPQPEKRVASLGAEQNADAGLRGQVAEPEPRAPKLVDAPLPPHRPADLAARREDIAHAVDAPLPPSRPQDLGGKEKGGLAATPKQAGRSGAASDALTKLIDAPGTTGPSGTASPETSTGTAPGAETTPLAFTRRPSGAALISGALTAPRAATTNGAASSKFRDDAVQPKSDGFAPD